MNPGDNGSAPQKNPRDSEHMAAIGKKGGLAISQNKAHMAAIGRKGGSARKHRGDYARIYQLWKEGQSYSAIARVFGMSYSGVRAVILKITSPSERTTRLNSS